MNPGGYGPPGGGPPQGGAPGGGAPGGYGPPGGGPPQGGAPGGYGPPGGGPPGGYGPPGGFGVNHPPGVAPQMGQGFGGGYPGGGGAQTDPLAIVSLVTGILSLLTGWCCALFFVVFALVSVITGIVSLSRIKSEPQRYTGKGLAWGGIGCCIAAVVVFILLMVFSVGMNIFAAALGGP